MLRAMAHVTLRVPLTSRKSTNLYLRALFWPLRALFWPFPEMAALIRLRLIRENNNAALRRERIFRDRSNALEVLCDQELMRRYRFPRATILELTELIREDVEHPTRRSHAIPAHIQV
jgi:hypothetical protein